MKNPATVVGLNLSQIQAFNRCRYRWDLEYNRAIGRRPIHFAMDLGSAVHAGIDSGLHEWLRLVGPKSGKISPKRWKEIDNAAGSGAWTYAEEWKAQRPDISADEQLEIGEVTSLAEALARRALRFLNLETKSTIFLDGEPLIEKQLRVELKGWDSFHGTADWVYKDLEAGGIWVMDYKVRESFTPGEAEQVDLQLAIYQFLLQAHGIPTTGSVKFQIRNGLPGIPKQNKDGSMSRADIRSDWETYKAALIEAKLDPSKYLDMKDKLADKEFFRLDKEYRNAFTINAMWGKIIAPTAKEILANKTKKVAPTRHMNSFNCNGCWAREFCLQELTDSDTDFLLATSFIDLRAPKPKLVVSPTDFSFEE